MSDENHLLEGIREITEKEIAELRAAADRFAAQKRESAEAEARRMRSEVESRVAAQAARLERRAKATKENERHRILLDTEEQIFALVLEGAMKRLRELIGSPEYPDLLRQWIVEAAIGLGSERAFVQCSAAEREICGEVLPSAVDEVLRRTGRKVDLELSPGAPLAEQGVILTAASGRTAYNNQVRTRLLRREALVRRAIFDALESERAEGAECPEVGAERRGKIEGKGQGSG